MSRVASVYLSKDERDRFLKVCEMEDCTPYSLVKKTVLDHIMAYPVEDGDVSDSKKQKRTKLELPERELNLERPMEPKSTQDESNHIFVEDIKPEKVSERVKKILEGIKDEQ